MKRPLPALSMPLAEWRGPARLPALVIGSGYGGAVAALRLAEAGVPVVVLERGSEYLPGDFPNTLAELPKHLRAPSAFGTGTMGSPSGVFDWHVGGKVISLVGNGLGGGSLINAGVALAPDDDVLRQACWPAHLRHDTDPPQLGLAAAFERARETLGAQPWADSPALPKTRALQRLAPFLQPGATLQPVAVTIAAEQCTRCGDCATGCNQPGAKLTLRDTYLARAAALGARLLIGATAYSLRPLDSGGWQVTVLPTERVANHISPAVAAASSDARVFVADEVFLAAGTFGSTELLQRSQAVAGSAFVLSPALGTRFSGNGDSLSFVVDSPEATRSEGHGAVGGQPPVGPTITGVVDLRRHGSGPLAGQLRPMHERLIVEDGATPGAIAKAAREMHALAYTLQQLDRFGYRAPRAAPEIDPLSADRLAGHTQLLLTMGHDGAAGRIVRLPDRDVSVPYWPRDPAQDEGYRRQAQVFAGVADAGGVHLHPPSWQLLPQSAEAVMSGPQAERALLTVHPLGGCPMGDDFNDGVVDHRGRVWRASGQLWPGLHVLDGSIVPSSLGVNPLLTITALAERAMAWWLHGRGAAGAGGENGADRPSAGRASPAAELRQRRAAPDPAAPPAPGPSAVGAEPEFDISLFERLTCGPGQLHGFDGTAWQRAELRLELGSDAWNQVWRSHRHPVPLRRGHLRLEGEVRTQSDGTVQPPSSVHYDVVDGRFELLSSGRLAFARRPDDSRSGRRTDVQRRLAATLTALNALLSALWMICRVDLWGTWLALRGLDDLGRATREGAPGGLTLRARLMSLARGLAHAAERRQMNYTLQLRRVGPGDAPETLTLIGRKRVGYAATCAQLLRWVLRHGWQALQGRAVPPPRPSFWQQITNPRITLLAGSELPRWRLWLAAVSPRWSMPWGWGDFEIDPAELVAQAPLLLHRGDLTEGLQAQAAYPALFLRYALKTHLFDFRLPDYSGAAVRDVVAGGDVLTVNGKPVAPALHRLQVRRGRSEGEPKGRELPAQLELMLWHYRSPARNGAMLFDDQWYGIPVRRARCVLLLHAFGQSGGMFTLPELQPNLAQQLLAAGFDVWVLEHRISTRLPYTEWPSTIDQIARWDVPAAVDTMLASLADEHGAGAPLQVLAFGQCIGAAALAMSLLDGQLSHGVPAAGAAGTVPALLPKLHGAVISQTHPFLVGTAITRAKTWVPSLLRNVLGGGAVPLAVRGPADTLAEAWIDRVFASLPVPRDEHCPNERNVRHRQDDCATCRRIRFIEAPLFKHANLSNEVHAALPKLFGPANLHLFSHAATCVDHERLVDNDARPVYVHDERMRRHFGLPLAFLHGAENELFHPASARRSAKEWGRLFPDLSSVVENALKGASRGAAWVVPGFGHVDVVIGRDAPQRVFAPMAGLFDQLWRRQDTAPSAPVLVLRATARPPRSGPWLGHVEITADGRLQLDLAFAVDDRFSDGKGDGAAPAGTRTWAWLRAGRGASATLHALAIRDFQPTPQGTAGYRIAHGRVLLPLPAEGHALVLRGVTIHEALGAAETEFGSEYLALDPASMAAGASPQLERWVRSAMARRAGAARQAASRTDWIHPWWRNTSPQRREGRAQVRARSGLSAAQLRALRQLRQPDAQLTLAAASCRYPGMAVDEARVDTSARRLMRQARNGQPQFALLLGDQIYADATAGVADSMNPVERFAMRHLGAVSHERPPWLKRDLPALADLLASMPVYQTQDDHEYRDGWPGSGPLEKGEQQGRARDNRVVRIAREAALAFQGLHMPAGVGAGRSYTMQHGPARFFVADSRNTRRVKPVPRILDRHTRRELRQWLMHADAGQALNCIVSGAVLLPRLAPGSNPGNPGEDTWAWSPRERRWLLALLAREAAATQPRRFLLLAGDYHLCATAAIEHAGRRVGAAVVSPPLYAPLAYTNTVPSSLWFNEDLAPAGLALRDGTAFPGSGFAQISVERHGAGFVVTVLPQLQDHQRSEAGLRAREPQRFVLA